MSTTESYPIGTPGKPWGDAEKKAWLDSQTIKRSYLDEVLAKLEALKAHFDVEQYGALALDPERYPLFALKAREWDPTKATVLVTGGVHGYETSGVQGALRFLDGPALEYKKDFNLVVAPCVSPWGYETINRWNPKAVDPNRSFSKPSPAEESGALMDFVKSLDTPLLAHFDLHETTDSDNSEFRPALAARDKIVSDLWEIPDGFYLVGDSENPRDAFQTAMIESVRKVTHIAPADAAGRLIGVPLTQAGVINYPCLKLSLCTGFSRAEYCTTTEVYPDSPRVDDENCIEAQVAAVRGGLQYLLETAPSKP